MSKPYKNAIAVRATDAAIEKYCGQYYVAIDRDEAIRRALCVVNRVLRRKSFTPHKAYVVAKYVAARYMTDGCNPARQPRWQSYEEKLPKYMLASKQKRESAQRERYARLWEKRTNRVSIFGPNV